MAGANELISAFLQKTASGSDLLVMDKPIEVINPARSLEVITRTNPKAMKRWVVGGSLAAFVVLAGGYRWWRRRKTARNQQEAVGALGDLGLSVPSWLTGGKASSTTVDLFAAASRQVKAAKAGARLDDYRRAPNINLFWQTARSDGNAYIKTAYWLAVASRLVGSNALGKAAARNLKLSSAYLASMIPGTGLLSSKIANIYANAAELIRDEATDNAQAAAIAKILHTHSDSGMIRNRQQTERESSARGIVADTITKTAGDLVNFTETARGIITGDRPTLLDPGTWGMIKWGVRAAALAVMLVSVRAAFGPLRRPRRRARRDSEEFDVYDIPVNEE